MTTGEESLQGTQMGKLHLPRSLRILSQLEVRDAQTHDIHMQKLTKSRQRLEWIAPEQIGFFWRLQNPDERLPCKPPNDHITIRNSILKLPLMYRT